MFNSFGWKQITLPSLFPPNEVSRLRLEYLESVSVSVPVSAAMNRPTQDEPEHDEHGQGQNQGVTDASGDDDDARTRVQVPPPVTQLPLEVADEIAMYLRSQLFGPISANIGQLKSGCEIMIAAQKDVLQEVRLIIIIII